MTVQNVIVKNFGEGNGVTTKWPFTFACPEKHPEYIKVYIKDADGNINLTTDFSVDMKTREVTYPVTGPVLPTGQKIVIARELPLHQVLKLVNQGPFFAEDLEITYDELVMMIQQLNEKLERTMSFSIDVDQNMFNPNVPIAAGKTYRVNADGTGFEVTDDPAKVYNAALALSVNVENAVIDAQSAANNASEAKEKAEQAVADLPSNWQDIVKKTYAWVTPELFGAKGDGITDDTQAIQAAFDSNKNYIMFTKSDYRITEPITIKNPYLIVLGNKAKIHNLEAFKPIFLMFSNVHDVKFYDLDIECKTTIEDTDIDNACFASNYLTSSTSYRYENVYNITFENCSFTGGTFGIAISSLTNVIIRNCDFKNQAVKLSSGIGGYGILLQSCFDVLIEKCRFYDTNNGRHDIYISVDGRKDGDHKICENIVVRDCYFNHETQTYLSETTNAINIRCSKNVMVDNNTFYKCACAVGTICDNGLPITDLKIINNIFDSFVFKDYTQHPKESRQCISLSGNKDFESTVFVENNIAINCVAPYSNFMSLNYFSATFHNNVAKCNLCLVVVNSSYTIINGFTTELSADAIRFTGTTFNGKITNVNGKNLSGQILNFSEAPNLMLNRECLDSDALTSAFYNSNQRTNIKWVSMTVAYNNSTANLECSIAHIKLNAGNIPMLVPTASGRTIGYYGTEEDAVNKTYKIKFKVLNGNVADTTFSGVIKI